eukprot:TRINITY_DN9496_c0_g1_i2.p1 TRINITY_DN9496_c0_g1~~TRINITY_DN9496_c0_g1_i2.p1  ORF type:complete len:210 (-),score=49.26 TRINITY_DN9496_c0_g1_i2:182-811(-)
MITYRASLVILMLAGIFVPARSIKCYRNMTGEAESCPTSGQIVDKVQSGFASVWKFVKDGVQDISGKDWIDKFGQKITDATGVDITSHEKNKDECNMDRDSARKAAGINLNARSAICNGEECPMADLSKIDDKYDFNSACYTGGEDDIVKCFTSDILYTPEAAALTRSRRSTDDGYELFNIDGVDNSGQATKGMLAVILGLAVALIFRL